jgi:hypothetical protein
MILTLPQTINTYTNLSRSLVSSLIMEMKVDKIQFSTLINKLSNFSTGASFAAEKIAPLSTLNREVMVELFRDSSLRVGRYFNGANSVGLALSSMIDVISSEIEKVEKDLRNLEIYIDNYEFLSGKDDQYNSNYLEKFDSLSNNYLYDGYTFRIPDRDAKPFENGLNSFIDSTAGALGIGSGLISRNLINNVRLIKSQSNYENSITSKTDFINLINDNLIDSWSVTIKSPTILTSQLLDYQKYINQDYRNLAGAKTAVEITLDTPVYMDTIRFNPNYGNGLALVQMVIFSDNPLGEVVRYEDLLTQQTTETQQISSENLLPKNSLDIGNSYEIMLMKPKLLERTTDISFTGRSVNKIIFIFNQAVYSRGKATPLISELNSKLLTSFIQELINEKRTNFSLLQDIVYWFFRRNNTISGVAKNKKVTDTYYSYRFPLELDTYSNAIKDEIFRANNLDLEDRSVINSTPIFIDLFYNMLRFLSPDDLNDFSGYHAQSTGSKNTQIYADFPGFIPAVSSNPVDDSKFQFYERLMARGSSRDVLKKLLVQESSDSYEYSFSLKSIEFFSTETENLSKACYVSKRIPVDGQIQSVKVKIETNDSLSGNETLGLDLKDLTSYEISVSNSELPVSELDWTPIIYNSDYEINSEVVFFNTTDFSAQLRFSAVQNSIILYKDGVACSPNSYNFSPLNNAVTILQTSIYSTTSIFAVKYTVNKLLTNPGEVNFQNNNTFKDLTKRYATPNGTGQFFASTDSNNSITLDYNPYINQVYSKDSFYTPQNGTVFPILSNVPVYSPIKVKLSDGSYAMNITNYSNKSQKVLFYETDLTLFVQSGKNLIFNKPINSSINVDYEYVPYNLRFRIIIRKNIPKDIASGKVDSLLLKMKTIKFDNYYNRLNNLSS